LKHRRPLFSSTFSIWISSVRGAADKAAFLIRWKSFTVNCSVRTV